MDGCDFYDYFVQPVENLRDIELGKLADHALPKGWHLTQGGRTQTALDVAEAIHNEYFNTGACEAWGPTTFTAWYIDGVLNKPKVPNMDVVH